MEKTIWYKIEKIIILLSIIISIIAFSSLTLAMTSVLIDVDPSKPSPKDLVTFTATFSDVENIENIRIIVEECKEGLCYTDSINESMSKINENTYEKQVNLKHSDATFIKFYIEYYDNGVFTNTELEQVDLEISSNNGDNNNFPGFELFILIITISVITIIIRKKRL